MSRQPNELDSFESALLSELKTAVQEMAPGSTRSPIEVRPALGRPRRRWQISVAAVAASALGIALLVPGLGPTPAFAVTGRNDGEVKVRVNRLEGADGLEQALREHGIPADVTYLSANKQCAPDRYAELRTPGLSLSVGADRFEVTIPPAQSVPTTRSSCQPPSSSFPTDFGRRSISVSLMEQSRPCRVIDGP